MIGLERGRSTAWKSLQISPGDPIMARPFGLYGLVTLSCRPIFSHENPRLLSAPRQKHSNMLKHG